MKKLAALMALNAGFGTESDYTIKYKEPEGKMFFSCGTYVREQPKIGRNHVCPCNSGKKWKKCHGA